MTNEELKKLRDGDIIRDKHGNAYNVLRNVGTCVIAVRTLELTNASEWELIYTATPYLPPPPAPTSISLVEKIAELEKLGWTFNENIDFWTSPDGKFKTNSLRHAWESRNNYPKSLDDCEMLRELHAAGWDYALNDLWRTSTRGYFRGTTRQAWVEMKKSV